MTRKSSFAPVADKRTKVLILGSLPGEKSLEARQYYANPTNQFWTLVGAVIGTELATLDYESRLSRLLAAGIGLWDVIADAERTGSLDASIRNHRPNQFIGLATTLPNVTCLAFNGGKPAKIGRKLAGDDPCFNLIDLPSSSAAYCSIPLPEKQRSWDRLREFLR